MSTFNRFDIVTAHYVFNALWHEGQFSDKYKRLCGILEYYRPSPSGVDLDQPGQENARSIYLELCKREGMTHWGEVRV